MTDPTHAPLPIMPTNTIPTLLCANCNTELDLADVWQLHPDRDHPSLQLCCSLACANAITQAESSTDSTPNAGVRDE